MRVRTIVSLVVVLLLLGGATLAQSREPLPVQYAVTQGATVSGGLYRLTSQAWQVRGAADGDGYHLTVLLEPTGTGTPCCCSYLPCMLKGD